MMHFVYKIKQQLTYCTHAYKRSKFVRREERTPISNYNECFMRKSPRAPQNICESSFSEGGIVFMIFFRTLFETCLDRIVLFLVCNSC